MHVNALDQMLEEYNDGHTDVSFTLRDGTIVKGRVKDFDGYVILLTGEPEQILYRHSILKLSKAAPAMREKPTARLTRPVEPKKRVETRPRPRPKAEKPPVTPPAAKSEGFGTLGEAMQKWLESQKK
jgi:RNA chaperone Hfq